MNTPGLQPASDEPASAQETVILQLNLPDETATNAIGAAFAPLLNAGDVVLLDGEMGAGKTCLARSLISARTGAAITVPSPTFNLVLVYGMPDGVPVWHFDLYRISDADELIELGWDDALGQGLSLVEWSSNAADEIPETALRITLTEDGTGRQLSVSGDRQWQQRLGIGDLLARRYAMARMLQENDWENARIVPFRADASFRSYDRVYHPDGRHAVLMNAPPGKEDIRPFVQIDNLLADAGFCPPAIYGQDVASGWLLLEDLGDNKFSTMLAQDPDAEPVLYTAAIDLLAELNRHPPSTELPPYDMATLLREAALFTEWYIPSVLGHSLTGGQEESFLDAWRLALAPVSGVRNVLVHRDYHVDNLIWRPERTGTDRIALLDFQDALAGHPAYDLASLLSDIRRPIPTELEQGLIARFATMTGTDPGDLRRDYSLLSAQRNTKILGIFTRLDVRDGKPGYLHWIPRGVELLLRDLQHPALQPVSDWFNANLPAGFLIGQCGGEQS